MLHHDRNAKEKNELYYNRRHGARDLPELYVGGKVRIKLDDEKRWTQEGIVINDTDAPRSYIVETSTGSIYRRNRKHLMEVPTARHTCQMDQNENLPAIPGSTSFNTTPVVDQQSSIPSNNNPCASPKLPQKDSTINKASESNPEIKNSSAYETRSGRIVRKPKLDDYVMY